MPPHSTDERVLLLEQQLAKHLGECAMRHADIIRRQDEASSQREAIRDDLHRSTIAVETKIDEMMAWVNQQKGGQKMALLALGALGTVGGIVGGLIGKAVFK